VIGSVTTSLKDMQERAEKGSSPLALVNPKKAGKKGYSNSGQLIIKKANVVRVPTFLDFVGGGMELCLSVAVDFTGSNGSPGSPLSLHHINALKPNQYQMALSSVGQILESYDSDKLFPAFGFGARLPNKQVSHMFALNGNPEQPYCAGVAGLLAAYATAITSVELWGPTNFASVINETARVAAASPAGSKYHILLIITDGEISDMDETKMALINASALPMSLIIIGVGNADFTNMSVLDADQFPLRHNGRAIVRDIVQFVAFREFSTRGPEALASAVLAEVPEQVLAYMKMSKIQPGQPKTA
jgi:hypothetical protein